MLAILVATLDGAATAILMANPEIGDDERPYWRPFPPTVPAAENVLRQLERLRRAISAYRRAAASPPPDPEPPPDMDIPF